MIKNRAKINEILMKKTIAKIKLKAKLKSLARFLKKKRERMQISKVKNE